MKRITTRDLLDALLDFRSAVEERFARIDGTLAEHSAILTEHSATLKLHSMALNRIERRLDAHGERLTRLESYLGPSAV
jgi:uncharacterized coiled-coil protein SlyX